jgi:broad specificity phosphatase PhoE
MILSPLLISAVSASLAVVGIGILIWAATRPRRFYFVRHGETLLNAARIRQGEAGGLSQRGRAQADAAGRFLAQFPIRRIIASPFERTKETAAIINEHLRAPVTYSALVGERRNPSEIIGRSAEDPSVAAIVDKMDLAYHGDDYRYSDEENFEDLKKRARKALALFSRQASSSTCVVTHGIFLKMLIAYLLYRDRLHAADYVKLAFFNASDNAAITVCEFDPWSILSPTRGWRVIEYNLVPE